MAFTLYPAIDLMGGRAVRLVQGERARMRVVDPDPLALAARLEEEGAPFLHVVDLDAAFGDGSNEATVAALLARVRCPIQVGGGVRDLSRARRLRELGAARVVLGTVAVRNPELVEGLLREDAEGVVVAVDSRRGRVAISGWTEDGGETLASLAMRVREMGAKHLLVTAVERDGTGTGISHAALATAIAAFGPGVIASGGVGSLDHLRALAPLARAGLAGVVVGSLLVDRRATVRDALAAVAAWEPAP